MSFIQFIEEIRGKSKRVEGQLIKTMFVSLLTSIVFLVLICILKFNTIQNFFPRYGLFLGLLALTISIIAPAIRQVKSYNEFPGMSGMMIGMTIGMVAGFLPGYFIGATNGLFIGSLFGMAIGISLGIWNGKCCGVMGVMEGIMAGFMGGLMGAMTAVMLINDYMKAMGIILFFIGSTIMFGLNYMIYKETKNQSAHNNIDQLSNMIITLILIAAGTWLMIFGPKSAFFAGA